MAFQSMPKPKFPRKSESSFRKLFNNPKIPFSFALLLADAVLIALIITYVPYTKIDWDAYMSQVDGFLGGERDYSKLEGDTGPLVYPAGFLYIYSAIRFVTGGQVYPAQILFGFLYIVNLGIILLVYAKTDVVPWWALSLLCLSKRVHSIFVLRLFNDCFAMTLLNASVVSLLYQKWHLGLIIFSGAVSIKMNVLLYAPPLLLLMLKAMNIFGVVSALAGAAIVQILLGLPFIISHPISYISRAFNLGRIFIHFWSVNFKFVPEPIFISRIFVVCLLVTHLILLAAFANYKWCKHEGGILSFFHSRMVQMKLKASVSSSFPLKLFHSSNSVIKLLQKEHIVTTMFVGNFIGIKWFRQGKHSCVNCRCAIPPKMANNPEINSALVVAIQLAKMSKFTSSIGLRKVHNFVHNQNRPDKACSTVRAKKAAKKNASSGKIFVTVPQDHFGPVSAYNDLVRKQGVLVGQTWDDWMECRQWGVHLSYVEWISGQEDYGAQSGILCWE